MFTRTHKRPTYNTHPSPLTEDPFSPCMWSAYGVGCADIPHMFSLTGRPRHMVGCARQDPTRIIGSGFIQFPPQRPFERPLMVQPATIAKVC